jgi:hypothetical protein
MGLTRSARRAYLEIRHRRIHGAPTRDWLAHPGSTYDLETWMTAFDIAAEEDVSPWDALLLAVRRRAARVRAVDRIIEQAWADHRALCAADPTYGNPEVPSAEVRTWMTESRNEERLMTRAAKMAVDAGVAEAVVRHMELAGRRAVDALVAGLDVLELSSEQRIRALEAAHRELLPGELPPAEGEPK